MSATDISLENGMYILRPAGTQDMSLQVTRDDLAGFIKANEGRVPMLVDLIRVKLLQSSGVGLLFFFLVEAQKANIRVGFTNASELVMKVLDIAGVQDIAKVYVDEEAARRDML